MALATRTIGTTSNSSKFNAILWLTQGALALLFLFAGYDKFTPSVDQMASDFDLSVSFLRFIGVCEIAGALGLILPSVSRIRTGLTALAACGLVVIMVGATALVAIEGPVAGASVPLFVAIAAALVAYGRTHVAPLSR